jgi:hypothetical protein
MDFVKSDGGIVATRSDAVYKSIAEPSISEAAVEIL